VFCYEEKNRFDYFYERKSESIIEIDADAAYLDDAQKRNFIKWPILGFGSGITPLRSLNMTMK